ncbi:hypothetical protein BDV93DRAFT_518918 [Ceratobasidium sp. AG-I]|nr:hypothetical protein BDV93DRAFT_518918 [Ceratobasidium sp. AG-I]
MQSYSSLYPCLNTQTSCVLDTSYNFPDGDISLLVEDTAFRVHRDKLVRHSHVFDDMFVVGHPDDDVEDDAEEPLAPPCDNDCRESVSVRMPDTEEEWKLVFSVLYPPKDTRPCSRIASIRDIAVALRMAEKYDVADVHAWAVAHFAHRYPHSLVYLSPNDRLVETASFALNLAHMYGITTVLPSIYFALATASWYLMPAELRELLLRWLDPQDVDRVLAGRNILWKRTLIFRHEAEHITSPTLAPYCASPGPSGHTSGAYSRASKSCRDILADRLREALGMLDPVCASPRTYCQPIAGRSRSGSSAAARARRMSGGGVRGVKEAPGQTLLDALQTLEEMDDMDIVVWPSPVCHVCSLVHSRWVAQTKSRTVRDMLEAFEA